MMSNFWVDQRNLDDIELPEKTQTLHNQYKDQIIKQ